MSEVAYRCLHKTKRNETIIRKKMRNPCLCVCLFSFSHPFFISVWLHGSREGEVIVVKKENSKELLELSELFLFISLSEQWKWKFSNNALESRIVFFVASVGRRKVKGLLSELLFLLLLFLLIHLFCFISVLIPYVIHVRMGALHFRLNKASQMQPNLYYFKWFDLKLDESNCNVYPKLYFVVCQKDARNNFSHSET